MTEMSLSIRNAFDKARLFLSECGMEADFAKGVLVALSGGADSVFLLHLMHKLSKEQGFSLAAFHVNHGIRGEEADRDEAFSRELAASLDIPFYSVFIDVPAIASRDKGTLEELARRERYAALDSFLDANGKYHVCATAHHATDHLETVLFHMARGTGLSGLTGISARRGRYLRPMLSLTSSEIREALDDAGISYVQDSTNEDTAFTRNYIRHELLPAFLKVHGASEQSVLRMSRHLSSDEEYLSSVAHAFLSEHGGDTVSREEAKKLHQAIFFRVVVSMYESAGGTQGASTVHVDAAYKLLHSEKSEGYVCFPESLAFCVTRKKCFFCRKEVIEKQKASQYRSHQTLRIGENMIMDTGDKLLLSRTELTFPSESAPTYKVNLSGRADPSSLYIRPREEGDSYTRGGHTKTIKKLIQDRKLSILERMRLPILCDQNGIVWYPGSSPRDKIPSCANEVLFAYFFEGGGNNE